MKNVAFLASMDRKKNTYERADRRKRWHEKKIRLLTSQHEYIYKEVHLNIYKKQRSIKPKDFCEAPQLFNLFYRHEQTKKEPVNPTK